MARERTCSPVSLEESISALFCCPLFATQLDLHSAVQTADGNWFAGIVSALLFKSAQRLLTAQCRRERAEEGEEGDGWEPGSLGRLG